jgi:hypothetical protein
MGVDPDLVDAAAKIPSRSFRGLSRGEMERFGIETRGVHETPWFAYNGPAGEFILLKSVTYPPEETGDEYRTRIVGLACSSLHPNIRVTYHSGLTGKQDRTPAGIRAKIGDTLIDLTTLQMDSVDKSFTLEPRQLQQADCYRKLRDHGNIRSIGDQKAITCRELLHCGIVDKQRCIGNKMPIKK